MSSSEEIQALVDFVRSGKTILVRKWDQVGHEQRDPTAVYLIESRGDYLAWNAAKNVVSANVVKIKSIMAVGDQRIVELDVTVPSASLIFRRPVSADETETWEIVSDVIDESQQSWRDEIEKALSNAEQLTRVPEPTKSFEFSRWLEWEIGKGLQPAGVVLQTTDGTAFAFAPFSGFSDSASQHSSRFSGWAGEPKEAFAEMSHGLGAYTTVSEPELIKASDFDDAVQRALLKFGEDVYHETGKAVFG